MPDTDVVYCEGWDPVRREALGTMTEAAAAARDRDGAQYAVLLRESGRPTALIQVAWAAGYLGVSQFDERARRVRELGFRVLDDPARLYRCGFRAWMSASPHDPEFFARRPRIVLSIDQWREGQIATVSEPRAAGTLRLPTGRVVAADPAFMNEDSEPFTVTVPPGEYPVSIAAAACGTATGTGGNRATPLDEYVTATRVLIRDEPAATWEMALRPGQDARMLPAGRFFGFGVDSGTAAFLDAAGRRALAARYAVAEEEVPGERPAGLARWTEDPGSGTNMVAFSS
ncbi:MAG: DUF4241 domain-containing protein, partial [Trebonia sp.]